MCLQCNLDDHELIYTLKLLSTFMCVTFYCRHTCRWDGSGIANWGGAWPSHQKSGWVLVIVHSITSPNML